MATFKSAALNPRHHHLCPSISLKHDHDYLYPSILLKHSGFRHSPLGLAPLPRAISLKYGGFRHSTLGLAPLPRAQKSSDSVTVPESDFYKVEVIVSFSSVEEISSIGVPWIINYEIGAKEGGVERPVMMEFVVTLYQAKEVVKIVRSRGADINLIAVSFSHVIKMHDRCNLYQERMARGVTDLLPPLYP